MHLRNEAIVLILPSKGWPWAILLLVVVLLLKTATLNAQPQKVGYNAGEKITYGAYYNWHFIWIDAGEVVLTADTLELNSRPVWEFRATGHTFSAYDLFYSVRDTFCAVVNQKPFLPLEFRRVINHGKEHSLHEYRFDTASHKIYSHIHRNGEKPFDDVLTPKKKVFDILTTAYNFRGIDFNSLHEGQQVIFSMLIDNQIENLSFRYEGIDDVKTRNGQRFRCYKLSVKLLAGDFFPEGEHMKVWLTADKNRIPIMVETQILVGSVKALFQKAEQLKFPMDAKLK